MLASAEGTKFSEDYGIFARMATSYFKPRETIRKSAHLGAPSLSLSPFGPVVLSHSHSAEDEDKTEMAPLKEPERAERTSKRTAFSAIHPPSLGMYRGRQNMCVPFGASSRNLGHTSLTLSVTQTFESNPNRRSLEGEIWGLGGQNLCRNLADDVT